MKLFLGYAEVCWEKRLKNVIKKFRQTFLPLVSEGLDRLVNVLTWLAKASLIEISVLSVTISPASVTNKTKTRTLGADSIASSLLNRMEKECSVEATPTTLSEKRIFPLLNT